MLALSVAPFVALLMCKVCSLRMVKLRNAAADIMAQALGRQDCIAGVHCLEMV